MKYNCFNYDNIVLDSIEVDIKNNYLVVDGTKYKIESCSEYAFKFVKNKVLANNGPEGLKLFINSSNTYDSPFNRFFFSILKRAAANNIQPVA